MEKLKIAVHNCTPGRHGVGDTLFHEGDTFCGAWALQGVIDIDDEDLCHIELTPFHCEVPGCGFRSQSLLESEQHYSTRHRYECVTCHKHVATPHLLDLHLCEAHDSYFALLTAKQASYACFVEECKIKFWNGKERLQHCVSVHKYPKDYRYDESWKSEKKPKVEANKLISRKCRKLETAAASGVCSEQITKPKKDSKRTGLPQHLGSGSNKQKGGSLNWYQQRQPPQSNKQDTTNIDMKDLQECLLDTI